MQAKSKKLIFIAVLLTGCIIITSLISTNDKAKMLPGGSSLLRPHKVLLHPKQRRQKQCACR